jgi:ribosomal protein S18 acetylase RimI-like enzyme
MYTCEDIARENKCDLFLDTSSAQIPAIGLYKRVGYKCAEIRTSNYYQRNNFLYLL